ncbi:WhiB family transcriptional regulator [Nocardioides aurantiacus]|uniref:Transcription factor WhiB n=1 Tax=Nocardioides aurantiacus TaxID=86796 RepID=A0A3N2CWZ2_9ACTN|nr:WhiB family transcriptional regulator [Nocardioides aurantiacus]ROR91734.1 transcription factor WhiB [Nocardioides aurantiacus]
MKTPENSPPPPCAGQHELFDSREEEDHLQARALCNGCHVFAACWDNFQAVRNAPSHLGGAPEGTWAGMLIGTAKLPSKLAPCGTESAYQRHRYNREDACEDCLQAHRDIVRQRAAAKRAEANPMDAA